MGEAEKTNKTDKLDKVDIVEKQKELLKEKSKNELILVLSSILATALIIISILCHDTWQSSMGAIVQTIEVLVLMFMIVVFVAAGFRYMDAKDSLKVLREKEKRGMDI